MVHGGKAVLDRLSVFENGRFDLRRSGHDFFAEDIVGGLKLDSQSGLGMAAGHDAGIGVFVPDRADHFLHDQAGIMFRSSAKRQQEVLILFKMLIGLSREKGGLKKGILDEPSVGFPDDLR